MPPPSDRGAAFGDVERVLVAVTALCLGVYVLRRCCTARERGLGGCPPLPPFRNALVRGGGGGR